MKRLKSIVVALILIILSLFSANTISAQGISNRNQKPLSLENNNIIVSQFKVANLEPNNVVVSRFSVKEKEEEQKANAQTISGKAYNVTESDLVLLAKIMQAESAANSDDGQLAVGTVVMNRVESSKFPNSIHDVVYQKGQFTPAFTSKFAALKPSAQALKNAQRILDGERLFGKNIMFFKATFLPLEWGKYRVYYATYGGNRFYT